MIINVNVTSCICLAMNCLFNLLFAEKRKKESILLHEVFTDFMILLFLFHLMPFLTDLLWLIFAVLSMFCFLNWDGIYFILFACNEIEWNIVLRSNDIFHDGWNFFGTQRKIYRPVAEKEGSWRALNGWKIIAWRALNGRIYGTSTGSPDLSRSTFSSV